MPFNWWTYYDQSEACLTKHHHIGTVPVFTRNYAQYYSGFLELPLRWKLGTFLGPFTLYLSVIYHDIFMGPACQPSKPLSTHPTYPEDRSCWNSQWVYPKKTKLRPVFKKVTNLNYLSSMHQYLETVLLHPLVYIGALELGMVNDLKQCSHYKWQNEMLEQADIGSSYINHILGELVHLLDEPNFRRMRIFKIIIQVATFVQWTWLNVFYILRQW